MKKKAGGQLMSSSFSATKAMGAEGAAAHRGGSCKTGKTTSSAPHRFFRQGPAPVAHKNVYAMPQLEPLFRCCGDVLALKGPELTANIAVTACWSFAQQGIPHGVLFFNVPKLVSRTDYSLPGGATGGGGAPTTSPMGAAAAQVPPAPRRRALTKPISLHQLGSLAHSYSLLNMAHVQLFDLLTKRLCAHYRIKRALASAEESVGFNILPNGAENCSSPLSSAVAAVDGNAGSYEKRGEARTSGTSPSPSLGPGARRNKTRTGPTSTATSRSTSSKTKTRRRPVRLQKRLRVEALVSILQAYLRVSLNEPEVFRCMATDLARRRELAKSPNFRDALTVLNNVGQLTKPVANQIELQLEKFRAESSARRTRTRVLQEVDNELDDVMEWKSPSSLLDHEHDAGVTINGGAAAIESGLTTSSARAATSI